MKIKKNRIQSVFYLLLCGERRELNPRVVDSQSTALVHLATSAPEEQINCLYLRSFLFFQEEENFLSRRREFIAPNQLSNKLFSRVPL